jgi:hypothetical protein
VHPVGEGLLVLVCLDLLDLRDRVPEAVIGLGHPLGYRGIGQVTADADGGVAVLALLPRVVLRVMMWQFTHARGSVERYENPFA